MNKYEYGYLLEESSFFPLMSLIFSNSADDVFSVLRHELLLYFNSSMSCILFYFIIHVRLRKRQNESGCLRSLNCRCL